MGSAIRAGAGVFQITACLAFASVWRLHLHVGARYSRQTLAGAVLGLGLLGAVALGVRYQLTAAPLTGEVYRLRPLFRLSSADRQKADRLFAVYRRESRPDEPIIASDFLFRYAHDRNLLWYNRLRGRPQARWILWDLNDRPLSVLEGFLRADAGSSLTDLNRSPRSIDSSSSNAGPEKTDHPTRPPPMHRPQGRE